MKYYKDVHYYIYPLDFPRMGVLGVVCPNTDGTVNVYINTLYTPELQGRALRHELRHMAYGHLWCDTKSLTEKELEADTDDPNVVFADDYSSVEYTPPAPVGVPNADAPELRKIPLFHSLDALRKLYEFIYQCDIADAPRERR